MRFYNVVEPNAKVLIARNERADAEDRWAQFRFGVYETDDKLETKVLSARKDLFSDRDPDFANKLAQAQGQLSPRAIKDAIERPGYFNCPICPSGFESDDQFINHLANEHGMMPQPGPRTPAGVS